MARIQLDPARMKAEAKRVDTIANDFDRSASAAMSARPGPQLTREGLGVRDPAVAAEVHAAVARADDYEQRVVGDLRRHAFTLRLLASDLRRRAALASSLGPARPRPVARPPGGLTAAQIAFLRPRGDKAMLLKLKLQKLAKRLGIRLPRGFDAMEGGVDMPTLRLIKLVQTKLGLSTALPGFDVHLRRRLAPIDVVPPVPPYPGNGASKKELACWLAYQAKRAGAPGVLPVMCALVESTLSNYPGGDRDSTGFFQIRVSIHPVPSGFGGASGQIKSESWWNAHPEAQAAWWVNACRAAKRGSPTRNPNQDDAGRLGNWCQDIERSAYPDKYRHKYDDAKRLLRGCPHA